MRIRFLGAAGTVTGSRHLIETDQARVLLDCGLYQGFKHLRERNWAPFPVPARDIDAVVLTHAHIDHSGWLPVLVREGFKGPIFCTAATRDLAKIMLLDSAHLQEEDARRANRGGYSRHEPALPLYTTREAERCIAKLKAVDVDTPFAVAAGIDATLSLVGHLLGAACVTLQVEGRTVTFSGDVGRDDDLLMPAPTRIEGADVLLVESTYGDRLHPREDAQRLLGDAIRRTAARGGSVLLPTFAVGRAQTLMLLLQRLKAAGQIAADMPIYLDSPMAQRATEIYDRHRALLRLRPQETRALADGVTMIETLQQSQRLSRNRFPCVILSASGMATGGRVLGHLAQLAPDRRNTIVFPGFQVPGTRGARMIAGDPEIKLRGAFVPVKAEVQHIEGLSGHADALGLIEWMRGMRRKPSQVFVVHGEPAAADSLRSRIAQSLGWPVRVAQHGESAEP